MSSEIPRRAPHLAALFQKAYAHAVTLQMADDQITLLFAQREKLEAELRAIQSQIHAEFESVLSNAKKTRLHLRAQLAPGPRPEVSMPRLSVNKSLPRPMAATG